MSLFDSAPSVCFITTSDTRACMDFVRAHCDVAPSPFAGHAYSSARLIKGSEEASVVVLTEYDGGVSDHDFLYQLLVKGLMPCGVERVTRIIIITALDMPQAEWRLAGLQIRDRASVGDGCWVHFSGDCLVPYNGRLPLPSCAPRRAHFTFSAKLVVKA